MNLRALKLSFLFLMLSQSKISFAQSTSEVWSHHVNAWEDRSLMEIISDYDEDSVLVLNNQMFSGREQIKAVFSQLFEIFDEGLNNIDSPLIFDKFVYIQWNFKPNPDQSFYGTDTFYIQNGKIKLQTIGSSLYLTHPVVHSVR